MVSRFNFGSIQERDKWHRVPVSDISKNVGSVKSFFDFFCLLFSFFEHTAPFTPASGLNRCLVFCFNDHGSFRNLSVGFSPTQTSHRSKLRP
jgi:hypothetical protein